MWIVLLYMNIAYAALNILATYALYVFHVYPILKIVYLTNNLSYKFQHTIFYEYENILRLKKK